MIKVAVFPIHEAKRIQNILADKINLELRHDEKTCTRGCTVTVEVWTAQEDAEAFMDFIKEEEKALLGDADMEMAESEIDLNSDSANCPACTAEFNPQEGGECPNCGLRLF